MQFEGSETRPRMFRCHCRRRPESNPLFRAVLSDDLEELKTLVEAGNSVNIKNSKGSALLNFVIRHKRVKIFEYLMSLDETDVNFPGRFESSPLIFSTGIYFDEYFALELIKKGANIHSPNDAGFTFLHLAAKSDTNDNLAVGKLVIEKGADLNVQGHYGVTPLYAACESGNFDWVCMLLYYGAETHISSDSGVLPISVISEDLPEDQQCILQEILFNYTFDEHETLIKLPSLVAAMTSNSNLFCIMLNQVTDILYDESDLQHMVSTLIHIKPQHLQLFIERFGYIVKEMIEHFSPMDILIKIALDYSFLGLKEIMDVFLNSKYVFEFIYNSDPNLPTISHLLEIFNNPNQFIVEEDFSKMIYIMLSYGLEVGSIDLDSVYNCYGYCELFQILLHMNISEINRNNHGSSIAAMFYNPRFTIDDLEDTQLSPMLLDYFNNHRLKKYLLNNSDESDIIERIEELPKIPLLVELSRDAVRKKIVERFNIQNSMQFYTIVNWLPIGEMNRKIIALEKKLY